jgi:hypothetical protein
MHSVSCLISASNAQHVEFGRVKGRRKKKKKITVCDSLVIFVSRIGPEPVAQSAASPPTADQKVWGSKPSRAKESEAIVSALFNCTCSSELFKAPTFAFPGMVITR